MVLVSNLSTEIVEQRHCQGRLSKELERLRHQLERMGGLPSKPEEVACTRREEKSEFEGDSRDMALSAAVDRQQARIKSLELKTESDAAVIKQMRAELHSLTIEREIWNQRLVEVRRRSSFVRPEDRAREDISGLLEACESATRLAGGAVFPEELQSCNPARVKHCRSFGTQCDTLLGWKPKNAAKYEAALGSIATLRHHRTALRADVVALRQAVIMWTSTALKHFHSPDPRLKQHRVEVISTSEVALVVEMRERMLDDLQKALQPRVLNSKAVTLCRRNASDIPSHVSRVNQPLVVHRRPPDVDQVEALATARAEVEVFRRALDSSGANDVDEAFSGQLLAAAIRWEEERLQHIAANERRSPSRPTQASRVMNRVSALSDSARENIRQRRFHRSSSRPTSLSVEASTLPPVYSPRRSVK